MATIRIDSILGGQSPTTHFAAKDQFQASLGIDPSLPIYDLTDGSYKRPTGLLKPTGVYDVSSTTVTNAPMWMIANPKDKYIYVYGATGSIYTLDTLATTVAGLGDLNDVGGGAKGNGAAYYDNYVYFACETTIARYGPLNGTPSFTDDYWVTTLSKSAMTTTSYGQNGILPFPNHPMHRHSDGKLYIADVQNNQGVLHVISTRKTSVEGDTDDGSTASRLVFGYGLYPGVIESYDSRLVIAINEVNAVGGGYGGPRAKLAFWDTTSTNFNSITWVEFPDRFISAMKNIDGILYILSGTGSNKGIRITQYVGGSSFRDIERIPDGFAPFAGGVDGDSTRLLIGSSCVLPEKAACVYSLGLDAGLSKGLFNIGRAPGNAPHSTETVTAVTLNPYSTNFNAPIIAWNNGGSTGSSNNGISMFGETYNSVSDNNNVWWSQRYKIGQPFDITRVRIPLYRQIHDSNVNISVAIFYDDGLTQQSLPNINSTNFPGSTFETGNGKVANIKVDNGLSSGGIRGQNNFWLELRWEGTSEQTISLPILIDFDIVPD